MYSIDRNMAHITSSPLVRKAAGIRLGRCSLVPPNEPEFAMTEVEVVEFWCAKSGIPYLGRSDIGHDAQNRVVPFGGLNAFRSIA
jgi:muramoyltetrapeptide carboxypeptidase